jgi:hypothetical protein
MLFTKVTGVILAKLSFLFFCIFATYKNHYNFFIFYQIILFYFVAVATRNVAFVAVILKYATICYKFVANCKNTKKQEI